MSTVQRVTTDLDLRALANRILDVDRTRSILIATTPTATSSVVVDTKTLADGLSEDHELWVVTADRTPSARGHPWRRRRRLRGRRARLPGR